MTVQDERVEVFRGLRVRGCFVAPGPRAVGPALALEHGERETRLVAGRADDRLGPLRGEVIEAGVE